MAWNQREIELKWQKKWLEGRAFEANALKAKKKFFATFPYPYMNSLLHIGHFYTLMKVEAFCRYKRMQGFNVLFPQGWHCTGSPIENAAQRIRETEPKQWEIMRQLGIPEEEIPRFAFPRHWAEFFSAEAEKDFKAMGIGVDWRRSFITTSLNPHYDKFVRWQFRKLKELKLVAKGKHPVVWCLKDNSPVGDHARIEGEGETPQEFTLLKFRFLGKSIVAATLRPETVFGQTNLWVDPELEYAVANVDGERWIASKECFEKLKHQDKKVSIVGSIKGREMVGKMAIAPGIDREIIVLPASFCDPNKGTGIVTSVPSDAPDDWIGLHDLQESKEGCEKFGLKWEEVKAIKPIPIIESKEFGDMAAPKVCSQLGIKNQSEREKLEEAKRIVYKKGFYEGRMTKSCGRYSGMPVEKAKLKVKEELLKKKKADRIFELSGKVVCRCLTPSIVKIVSDQWFIKYGDHVWKRKAHRAAGEIRFYPKIVREQFDYVIDWLNDWACTREFGLGTKLPWDEKWVIESLSDSTIYMAYYTVSHLLRGIQPESVNDALFDYLFLGKEKGIIHADKKLVEEMRREFLYWYPLDFRNSGKDLLQNHLAFFVFNHCAIFPEKHWPKGISVNGWVTVQGEKMSKSRGNFILLRELPERFGVDVSRLTIMLGGEELDDPNWDNALAESLKPRLEQLSELVEGQSGKGGSETGRIEDWFASNLQKIILDATLAMEETSFRTALQRGFFDLQNLLKKYLRRREGNPNKQLLQEAIEAQLLLLAPFAPHSCEELWQRIGKQASICFAAWPKADKSKIKPEIEVVEGLVDSVMEDIVAIKQLAKIEQPKRIVLYVAPPWKWEAVSVVTKAVGSAPDFAKAMKAFVSNADLKPHAKQADSLIKAVLKRLGDYRELKRIDELYILEQEKPLLAKRFGCEVLVEKAEAATLDTGRKAAMAMPLKPAIYME